jgi:hypothetical protein
MVDYDRLSSRLPKTWQKGYLLIRNKLLKEGGSFYDEEIPRYPEEGKGFCRIGGLQENLAALCPQWRGDC